MSERVDLRDRTLLVTGASRGIGRSVALVAAGEGARLLLTATSAGPLEDVAAEARARGADVKTAAVDLTDDRALETLAGQIPPGGLAGLVHSAGVCPLGPVEETSAADLDLAWQVNLRAPYLLTARLLPALREASGHVVFVNSGAGKVAKPGWSAYAATKHGLKALADSLRDEVAKDGVRVTTVYPGRTATDMQARVHAHEGKDYVPERFVRPGDVAAAVLLALRTAPPALVDEISVRPQ